MDRIVDEEAARRGIDYGGEILSLATLADAGVPSFDALRLVRLEFERVDATRLAEFYRTRGGVRTGVDIVGWLKSLPTEIVERCVRGAENRRVDYDLPRLLRSLWEF